MQSKSLRQLIGAKAHLSTDAIKVIVNVPPFRLRSWDLCMREFIRIQAKEDSHHLKTMMNKPTEKGRQLSPCAFLKQQSREWSSMTVWYILHFWRTLFSASVRRYQRPMSAKIRGPLINCIGNPIGVTNNTMRINILRTAAWVKV